MNNWPKLQMDDLSFDAKVIAGACFGIMGPKSSLTYEMRDARPPERMQAALDELTRANVISVEIINGRGGKTYRPMVDCHDAFVWVMKLKGKNKARMAFPMTEPIGRAA